MNKENIINLIAGGAQVAKHTAENLKTRSAEYIKENILNNEFVTQEEYQQLRQLVFKLSEEIKTLKKSNK